MPNNTNTNNLRVGSRGSRLALAQVEEVRLLLKSKGVSLKFDSKAYDTQGDKDKEVPLTENVSDDFFTDTVDQALLNKEIDIAVHSAKDLPQQMNENFEIFALTKSPDESDAFVGKDHLSSLAPGARIGTSSVLRKESLKKFYSKFELINIRGTIDERLKLIEDGRCDGIIAATIALKRLGLEHLIKDVLPWKTTPLQGQLAVVGRKGEHELKSVFERIDARKEYGKVKLVGAGPGDPELFTVKGIKALRDADIVCYDFLVHEDLLKYAVNAEKINVGKRKGEHTFSQDDLNDLLRKKAMEGKNVVRLKGGDPLVFGRGADEITCLRSYHVQVDVIPGISSATGLPSSLGIPLTARGISSSVAFVSGHSENEKNEKAGPIEIPKADTVVFLMGLTKLNQIISSLKKGGWDCGTPVMVISKGTRLEEKIVEGTIGTIEELLLKARLDPPALIIVSETIKFWQKDKYAAKENILFLGTNPEKYREIGRIIHFPMIEVSGVKMEAKAEKALIKKLLEYQMVVLTSRFAVRYFFEFLKRNQVDFADLAHIDFITIGESTEEALNAFHFYSKVTADEETSIGLLAELKKHYTLRGMKVLFPRSSLPNPVLKDAVAKLGAEVDEVTIYQNTMPKKRDLPDCEISRAVFTSPSTVRNFIKDYGTIPSSWKILCKGPRTKEALEAEGYQCEVLIYE